VRWLIVLVLSTVSVVAELLNEAVIESLMMQSSNRHIAIIMAEGEIATQQASAKEGAFDLGFKGKFERKEYPLSTSSYEEAGLYKQTQSGLLLEAKYRRAKGTQEYNNIKTGEKGEVQVGVNVPLLQLYEQSNPATYQVQNARLRYVEVNQSAQNTRRLYAFGVYKQYYVTLFHFAALSIQKELEDLAAQRLHFVKQKIALGEFPTLSAYEAEAMRNDYTLQRLQAQQEFLQQQIKLAYLLDISLPALRSYALPNIEDELNKSSANMKVTPTTFSIDSVYEKAQKNRSDLRQIDAQLSSIRAQMRLNATNRAVKSDVALNWVHDLQFNSGYKVGVNIDIPLYQRRYEYENRALMQRSTQLSQQKALLLREIHADIESLYSRYDMTTQQCTVLHQLLDNYAKVYEAYKYKYQNGATTLMQLSLQESRYIRSKIKYMACLSTLYTLQKERENIMGKILPHRRSDK